MPRFSNTCAPTGISSSTTGPNASANLTAASNINSRAGPTISVRIIPIRLKIGSACCNFSMMKPKPSTAIVTA